MEILNAIPSWVPTPRSFETQEFPEKFSDFGATTFVRLTGGVTFLLWLPHRPKLRGTPTEDLGLYSSRLVSSNKLCMGGNGEDKWYCYLRDLNNREPPSYSIQVTRPPGGASSCSLESIPAPRATHRISHAGEGHQILVATTLRC